MKFNSLNNFINLELSKDDDFKPKMNNSYSKSELESISFLTVSTITNLEKIDKLPNLKGLNIKRMFFDENEYHFNNNYENLGHLNLEVLSITNDPNIESLDLSNYKSLKRLYLISNPNLKEIKGLSTIKTLTDIIMVGNAIDKVDDFDEYVRNTSSCNNNILDVKIFNHLREHDEYAYQILSLYERKCNTNLKFAEKIGVGELFIFSYEMIEKTYLEARRILKDIITDDMSEYEKINAIYQYIVHNVSYDYEQLRVREDYIRENYFKPFSYNENKYKFINSSYNTINDKKGVCEGYTNMFNFLLGMIGVESNTIYCRYKDDPASEVGIYNHAASVVKYNDSLYYCDSQIEQATYETLFFMKTYDEFTKTHELSRDSSSVMKKYIRRRK